MVAFGDGWVLEVSVPFRHAFVFWYVLSFHNISRKMFKVGQGTLFEKFVAKELSEEAKRNRQRVGEVGVSTDSWRTRYLRRSVSLKFHIQ